MIEFFTLRVYGFLIRESKVLISKENIKGVDLVKLPGGGVEFGEGTVEALKREWVEELDLEINVSDHIHTTDFFQASIFNEKAQVIAVYYLVESLKLPDLTIKNNDGSGFQEFELIPLDNLIDHLTLPTDKRAAKFLLERLCKKM